MACKQHLDSRCVVLHTPKTSLTPIHSMQYGCFSGVWDLWSYFRDVGGNFTTIPEIFKLNGYRTIGGGKIFHPGHASGSGSPNCTYAAFGRAVFRLWQSSIPPFLPMYPYTCGSFASQVFPHTNTVNYWRRWSNYEVVQNRVFAGAGCSKGDDLIHSWTDPYFHPPTLNYWSGKVRGVTWTLCHTRCMGYYIDLRGMGGGYLQNETQWCCTKKKGDHKCGVSKVVWSLLCPF